MSATRVRLICKSRPSTGLQRIWKAKSSVLFQRGESAPGMFVVLGGTVFWISKSAVLC
jgi:hypothetical protein